MTATPNAIIPGAPSFSDYWEAGLAVIPINKSGIPPFKWGKIFSENWKPDSELLHWDLDTDSGFALVTGEVSGVIALDIDDAAPEEISRIFRAIGDTPCKKIGSKGLTAFYKYNGESNINFIKDGKVKVELLAEKRLTTIPPSKHRTKNIYYRWTGEDLLSAKNKLPVLYTGYKAKIESALSIVPPPEEKFCAREDYDVPPSFDEVIEVLNYCNPDCDNATWVQIGMSLRSEVGDAGFSEFDRWSQGGKAYDAKTIRQRWKSFNSRSITYGTLIHYAKQGGYKPPRKEERPAIKSVSIDNWTAKKLENHARAVQESQTLPEFYTNAPHHVKLICDWITSTARYPQHVITFGAVLSFLGFYMGREFVYKGIKSNLYNINLARSTHGKDHVLKCIRGLMHALDLEKLIGGSGATSDTAVLARLQKQEGKCMYLMDEFYAFMKVLSNRKSGNSREAGLPALLLKAYTHGVLDSADYADPKERETIVIRNPYLSLIAFCTPEPFYEAVGSQEAFNGLVGRMTIFEAHHVLPPRNKAPDDEAFKNPPPEIIRILKDIKANRQRIDRSDGGWEYSDVTQVQETKEAHDMIEVLNDEIDDKRREYDKENPQMSLVIGRSFELLKRYALLSSRGKAITPQDIAWAKSVTDYNIGIILNATSNITDTGFERKKNHTMEFIKRRGGFIARSELTAGCRIFDNRREREDVIADLIDAGKLEPVSVENTGGRTKKGYEIIKPA